MLHGTMERTIPSLSKHGVWWLMGGGGGGGGGGGRGGHLTIVQMYITIT